MLVGGEVGVGRRRWGGDAEGFGWDIQPHQCVPESLIILIRA